MKSKLLKKTLAVAMSAAMMVTTAASMTAFAATESLPEAEQTVSEESITSYWIEDHSIIDCTNRYKMNDGKFNFTIKVPAGANVDNIRLTITRDYNGTDLFSEQLFYFRAGLWDSSLTLVNSYDGSDYYELITNKFVDAGIGIKLYMNYNGNYYMATDTSNGSTTEGRGYWLSA